MDKEEILEESIRYLRKFYQKYSFDRMLPLFHGTSTYHYSQMKETGFLSPRGYRPSTWEGGLASHQGAVYFASIFEVTITHKSAYNAVKQADDIFLYIYLRGKYDNAERIQKDLHRMGMKPIPFDFKKDLSQVFLRLDNINKYRRYMARDEDENFQWLMKRSNYMSTELRDAITFCSRSMDWQTIVIFDCLWFLFDKDRKVLEKVILSIPPEIRSLYSNGTVAFITSIDINDLKPYSVSDYDKLINELQERVENACTESGERKLKDDFANGRVSEEKLKEFIKTVQIPRLKKLLT